MTEQDDILNGAAEHFEKLFAAEDDISSLVLRTLRTSVSPIRLSEITKINQLKMIRR